jgi:hypothetical protein
MRYNDTDFMLAGPYNVILENLDCKEPEEILERNYTLFDFSEALKQVKKGELCSRVGWNGRGMYIGLQVPTNSSQMTLPYIFMYTADKNRIPWLASQTDLLAVDWLVVERNS